MFLELPLDIRLIIYDLVLAEHQVVQQSRQPSNMHMRILQTCKQIYLEAGDTFHRYLSLRNEFEMERYYIFASASPERASLVRWADVANDGRIVETLHSGQKRPASQLHLALVRLASLERLRVFDVRNYHPYTISVPHLRYHLDFEGAMFPGPLDGKLFPHLKSYELYLDPSTRVSPFQRLPSDRIRWLRLSGDCHLAVNACFPALRHLTIRGITSNAFDKIRFHDVYAESQFDSFIHAQGHRLGFEIRNVHLESLVTGPGRHLRKLVLLGSTRLTTSTIASCLRSLPMLEYFALSLVTVNELRENFILSLGPSLLTLKLQITHAWYAVPLFNEERVICDSLEDRILCPRSPLGTIYVSFHSRLMSEDGRQERWKRIADAQHLALKIGPWEDDEET
ncbi:hypothetical protein HYDPIDRAFT_179511 [Hydnomerulius pinastri MD-312]|nr:hypothetical protein HYDPIDRAFT_179511 [Hydnomerulius pinastri MD-312]